MKTMFTPLMLISVPLLGIASLSACAATQDRAPATYDFSSRLLSRTKAGLSYEGTLKASPGAKVEEAKKTFEQKARMVCAHNVYLLMGMREELHKTRGKSEQDYYTLRAPFDCRTVNSFK